ncbi:hypothetical protein [Nitratireductor sp. XY-223]|uniref:hypothetical protein n=1 Tax=Nitratireductor sp. XY-223 TaxID=2561926 RepID=UPI0010AB4E5B|nr:hypothetical protein [Nitratireductor sp. XY-223]
MGNLGMIEEAAQEFDTSHVVFFESTPDPAVLKPNQVGVNIRVFNQLKLHFKRIRHNSAYRILADCCQDIGDEGRIGSVEDSARRLEIHVTTIARWRTKFADADLLVRLNGNGAYGVSPKVAVRIGADGKPIKARRRKNHFQF